MMPDSGSQRPLNLLAVGGVGAVGASEFSDNPHRQFTQLPSVPPHFTPKRRKSHPVKRIEDFINFGASDGKGGLLRSPRIPHWNALRCLKCASTDRRGPLGVSEPSTPTLPCSHAPMRTGRPIHDNPRLMGHESAGDAHKMACSSCISISTCALISMRFGIWLNMQVIGDDRWKVVK
jgi:hypothetical protein